MVINNNDAKKMSFYSQQPCTIAENTACLTWIITKSDGEANSLKGLKEMSSRRESHSHYSLLITSKPESIDFFSKPYLGLAA
ncbi:MAG: hypothetical protein F6K14_09630 [Symploca sp. SIO2C1]|nr:hypothetical protein [Symploca sp. SIO2C1]